MDLKPDFESERLMFWRVPTLEGPREITYHRGEQWVGADETVLDEAVLLQQLAGLQITLVDSLGQPVWGPRNAG